MIPIHRFLQYALQFSIREFDLPTCLGMVRRSDFMKYPIFFCCDLIGLLQKCVPLSLRRALGMPNLMKIFFLGNLRITLRNIVNHHNDVKVAIGKRKRTHEVNLPNIKQLYFNYATLRHLMPLGDVPYSLTSITSHDKFPCILEEHRLLEASLEYFRNRFIWSKMVAIG